MFSVPMERFFSVRGQRHLLKQVKERKGPMHVSGQIGLGSTGSGGGGGRDSWGRGGLLLTSTRSGLGAGLTGRLPAPPPPSRAGSTAWTSPAVPPPPPPPPAPPRSVAASGASCPISPPPPPPPPPPAAAPRAWFRRAPIGNPPPPAGFGGCVGAGPSSLLMFEPPWLLQQTWLPLHPLLLVIRNAGALQYAVMKPGMQIPGHLAAGLGLGVVVAAGFLLELDRERQQRPPLPHLTVPSTRSQR